MKKILLINPYYKLEIRWIADEEEIGVQADYFPLGLGTVAALTPDEFQVDIWDELVREPIEKACFKHTYDLVGVTSHSANLGRAVEIGSFFSQQGIPVVVGGPGVTSNPNRCRKHFNALFIGEAELIWPQFLREWQAGNYRQEYRQIEKPDMALSPLPKWDSIAAFVRRYSMGTIQTTRGCPIDCEFCDVIYLNGRRQRHKSINQILEELKVLEKLGVRSISFNDDNFTSNHLWAKEVLRELITLNNSFAKPLRFMTQLGIDIARDEELLELLADANFYEVLIGLETPNRNSLKEANKYNNLKGDLVAEVHRVLSYGIAVRGAMIVGFDHDEADIFDAQYEFIQKSYLPSVSLHMLNAPIGTRLWRRLREEGRVIGAFNIADGSTQRLFNNTIPKRMSRVQLMQGFRDLYAKVFTWESFKERIFGYVSIVSHPPKCLQESIAITELPNLGPNMKLDLESCKAMEQIFQYTQNKAPYLLARVKELIIQFIRYRKSVHDFIPGLERQIQLESSGAINIKLDNRQISIPAGFRKSFNTIFPDIYQRVYRDLIDKNKLPEALVEIFVDFLVHEEGFNRLEKHHTVLLSEISDRTCARFNEHVSKGITPNKNAHTPASDDAMFFLKDDILISMEHELMKLQLKEKTAEIIQ